MRSFRRVPGESQANRTLMGAAAGVRWALRQGRVLREPSPMVSQPVVLPAPMVESAAAEGPDRLPGAGRSTPAAPWKRQPSLRTLARWRTVKFSPKLGG